MSSFLLVADLDFTAEGEWHDGRLWLHCRVNRWSARVRRRLLSAFAHVSALYCRDLWVVEHPSSTLQPKFLTMLRFTEAAPIMCQGEMRRSWTHRYFKTDGQHVRRWGNENHHH